MKRTREGNRRNDQNAKFTENFGTSAKNQIAKLSVSPDSAVGFATGSAAGLASGSAAGIVSGSDSGSGIQGQRP